MSLNPADYGAVTMSLDPSEFGAIANIDEKNGAPAAVRTAVGAAKQPVDKLATLQSFYPDARPWGDDNFIYKDPKTGNNTLFNPKGLDTGDLAEEARIAFEFLGGSIGGAIAAVGGQFGPQVFTPEEAYTVPLGVGLGAAAGGQVYDSIAALFYPHQDTRSIVQKTSDIGFDVLGNFVGAEAGRLLESSVQKGITKGSALAKAKISEIKRAFNSINAEATAGSISGSKTLQGIEQALSRLPASADIIGEKYTKLLSDMGDYANNLARNVSQTEGRENVGIGIKEGADKFVKQFKNTATKLYDEVDKFIPKNALVSAPNFSKTIDDILNKYSGDPEFSKILTPNMIYQLKDAYKASQIRGGLQWNTLKSLRTHIGNMLDDKELIGGVLQGQLKQLYGDLSDDMTVGAIKLGGAGGERAITRAGNYWKAGRERIDNVLTPIVNKRLSQDIYKTAMQGTKDGSRKLRALKQSLPSDEWNGIVAQTIREMGLAKPGAQNISGDLFSPATFLTNYNNLGSSKNILFSNSSYKGLDRAVNNLLKTSAALKSTASMANSSGTAQQMMYMNLLTGGLGGAGAALFSEDKGISPEGILGGITLGAVLPWASAKLITSPKFINWLSEAGTIPVTSNGISAHLSRLMTIYETSKDNDLKDAIHSYYDVVSTKYKNSGVKQ